jgi:hypothetical protein
MNKQLFPLQGENGDLEELKSSFQEGEATVEKLGDSYYLSLEMGSREVDLDMLAEAKTALGQMNAIMLVQDERFRPPRVSGTAQRDPVTGEIKTTHYIFAHGIASTLKVGQPTITLAGETTPPRQQSFGEKAFKIAESNEALREAFHTYSTAKLDWGDLYSVSETIKKSVKGKIPRAWATSNEEKDFRITANHHRHGYGERMQVPGTTTLPQARASVQKLLQAWLNELIGDSKS